MNSNFTDLLKALEKNQVKYMVVGGYAVMHYSEPRYTKDFDVWVKPEEENAKAVYQSLKEFGAPLVDISVDTFSDKEKIYYMGIEPNRIDILMDIEGVDFDSAYKKRVETEIDGIQTSFISRDDLICAKRQAGRPKDLIDIQALEISRSITSEKTKPDIADKDKSREWDFER